MEAERAEELLARERARIQAELAELTTVDGGELSDLASQDPVNTGNELFERELDSSIADQLKVELEAIERAEKRLEQGTYGLSVESGEPIPDQRLEVQPWAERTVGEQERYESGKLQPS